MCIIYCVILKNLCCLLKDRGKEISYFIFSSRIDDTLGTLKRGTESSFLKWILEEVGVRWMKRNEKDD